MVFRSMLRQVCLSGPVPGRVHCALWKAVGLLSGDTERAPGCSAGGARGDQGACETDGVSKAGSPAPSVSAAVGRGGGSDLPCPHIPFLSFFPSLPGRPMMLMFIPAKKCPLNPFFPQSKRHPRGPLPAAWFLCWGLTDRVIQAAVSQPIMT